MSATYTPFGLKPVYHPSGIIRSLNYTGVYSATDVFYSGTPVSFDEATTAGTSTLIVATAAPTAGQRLAGVFGGVEYTDASGRRTVSKWFGPALGTATDVVMWIFMDPEIVYEIIRWSNHRQWWSGYFNRRFEPRRCCRRHTSTNANHWSRP